MSSSQYTIYYKVLFNLETSNFEVETIAKTDAKLKDSQFYVFVKSYMIQTLETKFDVAFAPYKEHNLTEEVIQQWLKEQEKSLPKNEKEQLVKITKDETTAAKAATPAKTSTGGGKKACEKLENVTKENVDEILSGISDLTTQTVANLKVIAKAMGIPKISAMKKQDLIDAITAAKK